MSQKSRELHGWFSSFFRPWFLDRFLEPKLSQNGPKMRAKIHPKSIQNLIHVFIDFGMRFWCQNAPRNGPQDHQKSWKYPPTPLSDLKNMLFSKIAPRLHENTIFEDSRSSKYCQNWPQMVQKLFQNPTEFLIEFWIDFWSILVPFWLSKLVQNGSKSDSKNVHKNRQKFYRKIDQKWLRNWSPGGVQRTSVSLIGPFLGTPCRPKGPHSAQGEALGGQMASRSSKMEPKWSQTWAQREPNEDKMKFQASPNW